MVHITPFYNNIVVIAELYLRLLIGVIRELKTRIFWKAPDMSEFNKLALCVE